jgi:hypothetical protein
VRIEPPEKASRVRCLPNARRAHSVAGRRTATSASWKATYSERPVTFTPVFISFSRKIANVKWLTLWGNCQRVGHSTRHTETPSLACVRAHDRREKRQGAKYFR